MNILFGLKIDRTKMAEIALQLGSDVPYCLMRGTALAEGRGEILTKLPALSGFLGSVGKTCLRTFYGGSI